MNICYTYNSWHVTQEINIHQFLPQSTHTMCIANGPVCANVEGRCMWCTMYYCSQYTIQNAIACTVNVALPKEQLVLAGWRPIRDGLCRVSMVANKLALNTEIESAEVIQKITFTGGKL